jgi:multidrug transporter EmrE-like cation transporter
MALEDPATEALHVAVRAPGSSPGLVASLLFLIVSVSLAAAGQLTLKSAMNEIGRIGAAEAAAATQTLLRAAKEPRLWAGLALFGVSALFWLVVLSRVPLSFAYPFVGVSYVAVVTISRLVLHEHVPALRWLGVGVVALGIALVGFSFRSTA